MTMRDFFAQVGGESFPNDDGSPLVLEHEPDGA